MVVNEVICDAMADHPTMPVMDSPFDQNHVTGIRHQH
jgi:hypothetical protein